jgi:hypothetical protein
MPFKTMTVTIACQVLATVGIHLVPAEVCIEERDERWIVRLPGGRLAWFAASADGARRLKNERRLLRLLHSRCRFGAPRVLLEGAAGEFDIRTMVAGDGDPRRIDSDVGDSLEIARRVGTAVGKILAEQHSKIALTDVADWLPRRPEWPKSREWVNARLRLVVDDAELLEGAEAIMTAYENLRVPETDCVLVHTDVGFHNLAIDTRSHLVNGLFDYDGAAWADRHHDFRYLVYDCDRYDLLNAALSVYEPAVGHTIQRERVLLYNAACALTFLAFRWGKTGEERSCGRTLAEDLRWSRHAIARVMAS